MLPGCTLHNVECRFSVGRCESRVKMASGTVVQPRGQWLAGRVPVSVDYFFRVQGVQLYVLTHCHTDHLAGLGAGWALGRILCSETTARIVRLWYGLSDEQLIVCRLHETVTLPLDADKTVFVDVTLYDANHCPGAVMVLFHGYFGTILHTGDCRFAPAMFSTLPAAVDLLLLDCTYCHPRFQLPSREQAFEQLVKVLARYPKHRVLVGLDKLGKEELLVRLAQHLGTFVVLDAERLELVRLMQELPQDVFAGDADAGTIHVVSKRRITARFLKRYRAEHGPTVAIIPSGFVQSISKVGSSADDVVSQARELIDIAPDVFWIPFSLHSSYGELREFVFRLQPRRILPNEHRGSTVHADRYLAPLVRNPRALPNYPVPGAIRALLAAGHREAAVPQAKDEPAPTGKGTKRAELEDDAESDAIDLFGVYASPPRLSDEDRAFLRAKRKR